MIQRKMYRDTLIKKVAKKKNHKQNPGNKKPNRLFNLERKEKKIKELLGETKNIKLQNSF